MIVITGGAGFIGSRLAEQLVDEEDIAVIDNLSSGHRDWVPERATFHEADIREHELRSVFEDADTVFHFAANPDVRTFPDNRDADFETNIVGTKRVLDACVDAAVDDIVFASSSVVYGEQPPIPTPETHQINPISMYGVSKVSGEQLCSVYADRFGMDATTVRMANILGKRNRKGVVYDFVQKLQDNPTQLEILGNGKQKKSYLHIDDTAAGIIAAWRGSESVYNVGNTDAITVNQIAGLVADEMDIDPSYTYTGGEQGWSGDVPEMRLAIDRLRETGWTPEHDSAGAVRKTVEELLAVVNA